MAGFFDRWGTNPLASLGEGLKRISNLGMKYDDMVIRQSRAIGPTEALLGGDTFAPRDIAYAFAMADISQKKYTAIFDKDYPARRDFLRKFALNSEIDFMITTLADEAIVYDDNNYFAYPAMMNMEAKDEIKDAMSNEFKKIYNYLGFVDDITGWQYFKQFLVDGTLALEIIFDEKGQNVIGFKELDAAFLKPDIRLMHVHRRTLHGDHAGRILPTMLKHHESVVEFKGDGFVTDNAEDSTHRSL
jgi:hypothetical protein